MSDEFGDWCKKQCDEFEAARVGRNESIERTISNSFGTLIVVACVMIFLFVLLFICLQFTTGELRAYNKWAIVCTIVGFVGNIGWFFGVCYGIWRSI